FSLLIVTSAVSFHNPPKSSNEIIRSDKSKPATWNVFASFVSSKNVFIESLVKIAIFFRSVTVVYRPTAPPEAVFASLYFALLFCRFQIVLHDLQPYVVLSHDLTRNQQSYP